MNETNMGCTKVREPWYRDVTLVARTQCNIRWLKVDAWVTHLRCMIKEQQTLETREVVSTFGTGGVCYHSKRRSRSSYHQRKL